jgi:hypothetical protein
MAIMAPVMRSAMLGAQRAPATPPPLQLFAVMMTVVFAVLVVLLVAVPAAFIWFYRNPNVRQ